MNTSRKSLIEKGLLTAAIISVAGTLGYMYQCRLRTDERAEGYGIERLYTQCFGAWFPGKQAPDFMEVTRRPWELPEKSFTARVVQRGHPDFSDCSTKHGNKYCITIVGERGFDQSIRFHRTWVARCEE